MPRGHALASPLSHFGDELSAWSLRAMARASKPPLSSVTVALLVESAPKRNPET